jgi:hypothetical protein
MPALHLGTEGQSTDGINGKVGVNTSTPSEPLEVNGNIKMTGGGHSTGHLVLGQYHIWVDPTGKLRIKSGIPTYATDGTIV